jgi:hypothetical protein
MSTVAALIHRPASSLCVRSVLHQFRFEPFPHTLYHTYQSIQPVIHKIDSRHEYLPVDAVRQAAEIRGRFLKER